MEANKSYVTDVLGGNKKVFIIPIYQRNYSWKKKECLKLFNDIVNSANYTNVTDYFIGTIVYTQFTNELNYNEFLLIDGQQRLVTISLLLKAISHKILERSGEDVNEISETYLRNKKNALTEYGYVLKLKPNSKDAQVYEEIMDDKDVSDKKSNLYINYNLFLEWLEKKNQGLKPEDIFKRLERVKLVYISLTAKEDDPQLVFETINSTGQDLEFSDLIRNFILTGEKPDDQNELYSDYWRKIEDILTDDKGNSLMESFMRSYLTMMVERVFSKENTYITFRDFYTPIRYKAREILGDMVKYAEIYKDLENGYMNNKDLSDICLAFYELDYTLTYPFLLKLIYEYKYNSTIELKELKNIISLLVSFVFRKTIVGTNLTQQFASLMATMYGKIKDSKNKYNAFALNFIEQESAKLRFTKDDELKEKLSKRDVYNSRFKKYILVMIENSYSKEKTDFYSPSSNITVDHIMPQDPNEEWIRRIPDAEARMLNKDRLGNLTLTAYNSEKGNRSIDIYTNSKIKLNNGINIDTWNLDDIENRTKALMEDVVKIWPYPNDVIVENKNELVSDSYISISELDENDIYESNLVPSKYTVGKETYSIDSWDNLYIEIIKYCKNNYKDKIDLINNFENSIDQNLTKQIGNMKNFLFEIDDNLDIKVVLK